MLYTIKTTSIFKVKINVVMIKTILILNIVYIIVTNFQNKYSIVQNIDQGSFTNYTLILLSCYDFFMTIPISKNKT